MNEIIISILLSRNGEESFNKFLSPDPDNFLGGPSHGHFISLTMFCLQSTGIFVRYFVIEATGRTLWKHNAYVLAHPPDFSSN